MEGGFGDRLQKNPKQSDVLREPGVQIALLADDTVRQLACEFYIQAARVQDDPVR